MFLPKIITIKISPSRFFHTSCLLNARNIKPFNVGLEGEYRKARAKKVIKVDLPDIEEIKRTNKLNPDEYISKLKEKGIAPPRIYKEKPITITCLNGVLDPYVPPEGDGKYTVLSKEVSMNKDIVVNINCLINFSK